MFPSSCKIPRSFHVTFKAANIPFRRDIAVFLISLLAQKRIFHFYGTVYNTFLARALAAQSSISSRSRCSFAVTVKKRSCLAKRTLMLSENIVSVSSFSSLLVTENIRKNIFFAPTSIFQGIDFQR